MFVSMAQSSTNQAIISTRRYMTTLLLVAAILSTSSCESRTNDYPNTEQASSLATSNNVALAKVLQDARHLIGHLRASSRGLVAAGDINEEAVKREAAWDMDYGWGGGRFGKRRPDLLGMAGRFGRSVNEARDD